MSQSDEMRETVHALTQEGKGLLAADESTPTISRRFQAVGIDSTPETRRAYRTLLLGTAGLGDYISGVILYEETLHQRTDDDMPLPELAQRSGIIPGIKVDKGTVALPKASGDKITQGLDFLGVRSTPSPATTPPGSASRPTPRSSAATPPYARSRGWSRSSSRRC